MLKPAAKRTTIKDVARQAKLSLGTVSGILNGGTGFAPATRRRVWDAANALNYRPNSQARGLRTGGEIPQRQKSGIIIHITHLGNDSPVGNTFESARSSLLAWEAEKLGMYPITYWYHRLKGFQCPPVLNGHVDGAIVGTPHLEVVNILKPLVPLVLMDVPFSLEMADVPMVNTDCRHGFRDLFARLRELGHRRIGTITAEDPREGFFGEAVRFTELLAAAAANGIDIHPECRLQVKVTPQTHEQVMAQVAPLFVARAKAGDITAVVCPCESYATSFASLFTAMGVRLPDDLSLASIHTQIQASDVGISAFAFDWPGLVRTSLEVLRNVTEGRLPSCREFLVPPVFCLGKTLGVARA